MGENLLDLAIQTARRAAEGVKDFRAETYQAVLLYELMRMGAPSRSRPELASPKAGSPKQEKPYSPAEFISSKAWTSEVEKVVLAGYFLEHFAGSSGYSLDEIRRCLIAARVSLPRNLSLAILQAGRKGMVMEVPSQERSRKVWVLTQSGERYVEAMAQRK